MRTLTRRLQNFQMLGSADFRSVIVDQSVEGGGENLGFRPTELWMLGLSSCSATTLTRRAQTLGLALTGLQITAFDEVTEENYIRSITFCVALAGDLTSEQKADLLAYTRENCKLLRTIHPDIAVTFEEDTSQSSDAPADSEVPASGAVVCTLEGGNCCG